MRTYLEWNQSQGFKAHGLHDRHVLRGLEAWTRNDRSGTGADIKGPGASSSPNRFDQVVLVEFVQQSKRVPATNKNNLGLFDCTWGIGDVVHRHHFESHLAKTAFGLCTVCPPIVKRIRNKDDTGSVADEVLHFRLDMIEIAST